MGGFDFFQPSAGDAYTKREVDSSKKDTPGNEGGAGLVCTLSWCCGSQRRKRRAWLGKGRAGLTSEEKGCAQEEGERRQRNEEQLEFAKLAAAPAA